MSVDAFTVEGEILLDTSKFQSSITKVTNKLNELSTSFSKPMDTGAFINSFQGIKGEFNDLTRMAKEINSLFKTIIDVPKIIEDMGKVKAEIQSLKEDMAQVKTETTAVATEMNKVKEATVNWKESLSTVSPNFQNMATNLEMISTEFMSHTDYLAIYNSEIGQINAKWRETQELVKSNTQFIKEMETTMNVGLGASRGVTQYFMHEQQLLESNLELIRQKRREEVSYSSQVTKSFSSLMRLGDELERQVMLTQKRATSLGNVGRELVKQGNEIKRNLTYEEEMLATENLFKNALSEEMTLYAERVQLEEQIRAINESDMAIREGIATNVKEILAMDDEELAILRESLALEEEKLAIEKQQTAEQKRQNVSREQGNLLDKGGYLGRRIGSMAVTMLGYQEIMDVWNKTTSNINAKTQFGSYAKLLKEDNRYLKQTKQSTADVTKGINDLNYALEDTYKDGKSLQQMYSKVDMRMVGANALDTAFKYGVQADNLKELTEVMAIYSSEFVRQGRTQEESILAVNDALDGEFRRLKEVNIGKEELEAHGYEEGNQLSLIRAMREIAEERGYDVTAQKITTLSEAINQAELELAFLLSDLFEMVEPSLINALGKLVQLFRLLGDGAKALKGYLKGLPQPVKDFLKDFGGNAMLGLVGLWIGKNIWSAVSNMSLFGGAWEKLMGKLGRTKGMDKATESMGKMGQTTGGTVGGKTGSAKDGLKNWGKNLAKNLGKMAEIFIEVAVAIAMAWALLKEAMFLISDLGKDWEAHKQEFNSGIDFIKSYGIWIIGISAVLGYLFTTMSNTPVSTSNYVNMAKNFGKVALGLALAMGLIAEAIVLLNAPLLAVASIGMVQNWQKDNIETGMATIRMFGDAINYIANDDTLGWFVIGLVAISGVLGLTADVVAVPFVIGIATTLLLVAEAIAMLIAPLGAIALLGASASALGEENINQGAETIKLIGRVLKVLSDAMVDLFIVDLATLGVMLVDKANQLISGKTGLQALTDDIIPSLTDFISDFNGLDMGEPVDQAKVQAITQMATDIPPLFTAIQKVNNAMGTSDAVGNIFGAIGGGISGAIGMGLSAKLDQLYNDIKDVMDFANKLGGLSTGNGANSTAIQQTANAIVQLKTKLNLFISTISGASARVQTASQKLGNALPNGFKTGSASFGSAVVSVLAKGVSEIQSRYATFNNGGKTLGQKMVDGFKNHKPTLKTIVVKEMDYALKELDDKKDDFYNKGQALGKQLSDGFESSGGLNVGSPANIARTIAKEMEYSMLALDNGKQLMYKGGQALGQALTNGYNSYGNLRTDVGVLASKGVSNEQLQANAKSVQGKGKGNQQNPQLTQTNINIDMSNSTVIGVQDLDAKIRQAVEKAIVNINSPNGAIGY